MFEISRDDPKLTEFVSEALALNNQLLQHQEELCQTISQWNSHCEIRDKITNQVVELLLNYDLIDKRIYDYLKWQELEEGKKECVLKINESNKEMLFHKWDAQIKNVEQAAEEVVTATNNVIDYVNENLHRANLISETAPGFLPKA